MTTGWCSPPTEQTVEQEIERLSDEDIIEKVQGAKTKTPTQFVFVSICERQIKQ